MRVWALATLVAAIALGIPAYADEAAKPVEPALMFGGGGPDAKRAVFVFALSLTHQLQRARLFAKTSFVVPEGTWTTAQFLHQCDVERRRYARCADRAPAHKFHGEGTHSKG